MVTNGGSQEASFNGIAGTWSIDNGSLFFQVEQSAYKWSFATWIRSEKSKKSAKVRITFTEGPLKLTPDDSHLDTLEKAVIVVDFGNDRDALERFTALVSSDTAVTKAQAISQPPKEEHTPPAKEVVPLPTPLQTPGDVKPKLDEHQIRLLETNPDVARLYQQLVEAEDGSSEGVISADDFWKHHGVDLLATLKQPEAASQVEGFIAMPPTNEFVNGQLLYRYNPELGKALLAEDDTIRALHKKFIIDKQYPEENFWKRILQSHYFYNLIGEKVPDNQILYDDIKGVPIKKIEAPPPTVTSVLKKVDMFSDLIRLDDHRKRRLPESKISKRFGCQVEPDFKSSLFERFNKHSCKIIDSCQAENSASLSTEAVDNKVLEEQAEMYRRQKIAEASCKDLAESVYNKTNDTDDMCLIRSLNMPGNKMQKTNSFEEQRNEGKETSQKISFKMRTEADVAKDIENWANSIRDVDILKTPVNNDTISRRMFILNTKLCQTEKITQTVPLEYDPSTISKMQNFQRSIIEILQLYYKTLLPEEQKRVKLLMAVRHIKRELESQHEGELSAHAAKALQTGLMNQITAVEVYDTKLKAFVAELRNQAQRRMAKPQ